MLTDPWQLAWADLVTRNNIAGVFQGGRRHGGQCQYQSGALLATWSRLLLPPIPPTQSSSTLTTSPPQLSHNGLLTRTAQASTTSPDLSVIMRWELHCITCLLWALWPALCADCAQKQFGWMPSRQIRTTFLAGPAICRCVISYKRACAWLLLISVALCATPSP